MGSESFREQNRLRRERNAAANLAAYAQAAQIPDAARAAESAAAQIHGEQASQGREERLRAWLRASAEKRLTQRVEAPAPTSASPPAAPPAERARKSPTRSPGAKADTKKSAAPAEKPSIPHRLEDRTKEQLYARAQELEIEGRSQMSKEELIEAIRGRG